MEILQHPHPALREKAVPVDRVDADLRRTVREMFELMHAANGVGLAATQVGLPLRLFITYVDEQEAVFINPVLSRPKGSVVFEEGCLSLLGQTGLVRRPKQVRVEAWTLGEKKFDEDVWGRHARVIQHENDHLDGILFTDRLADVQSFTRQPRPGYHAGARSSGCVLHIKPEVAGD